MLTCGKCGDEYEPYPHCRMCRPCYNKRMRVYMLARYYRRRAAAIDQLGGQCVDCDTTEDLELDHADAALKSFDIGKALGGWSEVRVQSELRKCVLRCKPCHLIKSIEMGDMKTVPHGGGVSGKRNCKCRPCKDKKNAYLRNWKAERKASRA